MATDGPPHPSGPELSSLPFSAAAQTVGEFQRALKTLGLALSARETAEAVAALGFAPASLAPGAVSRLGQAGRQAMGSFPHEGCVDFAALLGRVEAHEEFTARG